MKKATFPPVSLLRRLRVLWLLAIAVSPAVQAGSESRQYQLDPVHTRVMFSIEHAGYSHAIGTLSGSTGTLDFDPQDWTQAHLQVTVPLDRVDLGDEEWNQATLASNLLDVARFPQATFISTRIEPVAPDRASVFGMLTLHGVSREIMMEVTLNALKRYPLPPFRRTAGFSATATIRRADFGITAWKSLIGDQVELRIEAEAYASRGGSEPLLPQEPPAPDDQVPARATDAVSPPATSLQKEPIQ